MGRRDTKRAAPRSELEEPGKGGEGLEPADVPARRPYPREPWSPLRTRLLLVLGVALVGCSALLLFESRTSYMQSRLLSSWAAEISHRVEEGPSERFRVPPGGPYDARLGHARIPEMVEHLEDRGFVVHQQARTSERFHRVLELGLFPIYEEKSRAGLTVLDRSGRDLYRARFPERVYASFDSIPELIRETLLFIENRRLLDPRFPRRNPAVEWDRLAGSVAHLALRELGGVEGSVAGASTLATQIEKFRHSPDGLTRHPRDKLVQMASASLRAYRDGPLTVQARQTIVLDYLNSVPLSAVPGYGEVTGLQDGLWAWYGMEPAEANARLAEPAAEPEATGRAYRAVLGLMLAQRRPSFYLAREDGRRALQRLGDVYLDLLREYGVISPELYDAARAAEPSIRPAVPAPDRSSFVERKAATSIRTHLLGLLGVAQLYELDRYDVAVRTGLDGAVQEGVTSRLLRLEDPVYVREAGLGAFRLLAEGDPAGVIYSVVLYERTPLGNVVRVQTDNFDGPFDLNQSARLELGSTAKLRTLVTYLQVIERLHGELEPLSRAERRAALDSLSDPLSRWAVGWMNAREEPALRPMLEAAMERTYSASPAERFFTGGGQHVFQNFDRTYDRSSVSVRVAFRHSVNLAFVRMMRDLERWYALRIPGSSARVLQDPGDPRRREYLARFADHEGRAFVGRFYARYAGRDREEILRTLAAGRRLTPQRLAWAFRTVDPDAGPEELEAYLLESSPETRLSERAAEDLYARADAEAYGWADRGYLAGVHPLELWVARYLVGRPEASRLEALEASAEVRQEVYAWLFAERRRAAQDRRIRTMIEAEAFAEIARDWQALGYPFVNLVPSYGSAIGSSGDRPSALAELAGILLAGGIRHPTVRAEELRFAEGTPWETRLGREPAVGERVLSEEVAAVALEAMRDVVDQGTARAVRTAFRAPDGGSLPVGGKTGTGNNQYKVFGSGGRLLTTRTVNRTATFVFTVGDRFFGVVTAHVPGPAAEAYRFTSALPVQVLRLLSADLEPLWTDPSPRSSSGTSPSGSG